jgi:triphosphatase
VDSRDPAGPELFLRLDLEPEHLNRVLRRSVLRRLRRSARERSLRATTWWDTPDHDLARSGVVLRVEEPRGNAEGAFEKARGLLSGKLHPGEDRPETGPGEGVRVVFAPVGRAEMECISWEVGRLPRPGQAGKDRSGWKVQVRLERGSLSAAERGREVTRVTLRLLEGAPPDLWALALALGEEVPVRVAGAGEARQVYALAGSAVLPPDASAGRGWVEAVDEGSAGADMDELLRTMLRGELRILGGIVAAVGEPGGVAPKPVHQARLSARRIRALLRVARPLLAPEWSEAVKAEVRGLLDGLAPARDLHVLRSEVVEPVRAAIRQGGHPGEDAAPGPEDPDLEALARRLDADLEEAEIVVDATLGSPGVTRLLLLLAARSSAAVSSTPSGSAFASEVLRRLETRLRKRIRKRHRQAARAGGRPGSPGDLLRDWREEERHDLRLQVKRLHDAWRILAPVLPKKRVKRNVRVLSRLRSLLGTLNDLAVAAGALKARHPGGALLVRGYHLARKEELLTAAGKALDAWIRLERSA